MLDFVVIIIIVVVVVFVVVVVVVVVVVTGNTTAFSWFRFRCKVTRKFWQHFGVSERSSLDS